MGYALDLEHALRLADTADSITMRYYRAVDLRVTTKPDETPVTQGDLETERALSRIVTSEYHEGYLGEEGIRTVKGKRLWVVDPIDGTKNFVRGMPVWATLLALIENDTVVVAAISAPALGRRWWASKGEGTWTRGVDGAVRRLNVSSIKEIANAFVLTGSLYEWDDVPTGLDALLELIKSASRHRAIGDFLNYMLVAEGGADVCTESKPKFWDIAAPSLIIAEAGGSLWTNATPDTSPDAPRIVVGSNGLLEIKVRQALKL